MSLRYVKDGRPAPQSLRSQMARGLNFAKMLSISDIGGALAVTFLLTLGTVLEAQDGAGWVGKRVVQRTDAFALWDGPGVQRSRVFTVQGGPAEMIEPDIHIYRVEREENGQLLLYAEESCWHWKGCLRGWVSPGRVVPVERAIALFTDEIRADPTDPFPLVMRATVWHDKKDVARAMADFTEAIRLDSGNANLYRHRGFAWKKEEQYDKAIADFTEVIRLSPEADAYLLRAETRVMKPDYDKAIADLTEALHLQPGNSRAHLCRGLAWSSKQEYEKATADFTEVIRLDPESLLAYQVRGVLWADRKEYDKAIADFTEVIRIDPDNLDAHLRRGVLRGDKKDYDKAIADFTEAVRIDPDNIVAYQNRGVLWADKNEYDRAIADLTEAIRINPRDALAFLIRGSYWLEKHMDEKALVDFTKAIAIDPKDPDAFTARADAWLRTEDYDKAIADCTSAILVAPKTSNVHALRAAARFAAQRDGIESDVERVLELDGWRGRSSIHVVLLGHFAALRGGRPDDAKRWLDNAAVNCDTTRWPYPIVRYLRGELDEAKLMTAAANGHDETTQASCYLGLDQLQKGRNEAAQANFRWVKEHGNPSMAERALSIAELERLRVAK